MEFLWYPFSLCKIDNDSCGLERINQYMKMKGGNTRKFTRSDDIGVIPNLFINSRPTQMFPPFFPDHPIAQSQTSLYYRRVYPDPFQFAALETAGGIATANPRQGFLFSHPVAPYYISTGATNLVSEQQKLNPKSTLKTLEPLRKNKISQYHGHSTSYMKRNVYKSIIRAMPRYAKSNEENMMTELREYKFSEEEIQKSLNVINELSRRAEVWKNPRKSQSAIAAILAKRTPCTYILKETLYSIMNNWTEGFIGRVSRNNLHTYKEVYQNFYKQSLILLNTST